MDAAGWVSAVATVVLVGVTVWYAMSTQRMLRQMQGQARVMREQSRLLALSAEVNAWHALMNAAGNPPGQNPFERIRALIPELEKLSKVTQSDTTD